MSSVVSACRLSVIATSIALLAAAGTSSAELAVGSVESREPGAALVELEVAEYLPLAIKSISLEEVPRASPPPAVASSTPTPTASPAPGMSPTPDPAATATAIDCGSVPTFADGLVPTSEVHVAVDGSDDSGDGSRAHPFASLSRAIEDAVPGTAIRFHAGTYPGGVYVRDVAGTAEAPIWIGGLPGARPVLDGGTEGLHIIRGAFLVVHDLEVRGAGANGINCDDGGDYADPLAAHHVLFRNVSIHDIGGSGNQDCLKLSGLSDFVVADSQFARCGGALSGSGIDCVGCHRGVVARCEFDGHAGNAVQAKGGTTDIEIRWNRIHDGGARALNMGGSTGTEYFRPPLDATGSNAEARRIRVIANIIEGSDAALAFVGCVDCVAVNNTIIDPEVWILRILQETQSNEDYDFEPASRGRFINNLVAFRRSQIRTYLNIGPATDAASFSFAHNLWFAADDPSRSGPLLPAPEFGAVVGLDPLLLPDGSVDAASPAVGAGTYVEGVRGDIAGACYADPPTIGAYEIANQGSSGQLP